MKKVLGTLVFVFICLIFSVLSTSAQTNEELVNTIIINGFIDFNNNGVKDSGEDEVNRSDNLYVQVESAPYNNGCQRDSTVSTLRFLGSNILVSTQRCYWFTMIDGDYNRNVYDLFLYDPTERDEPIVTELGFDPFKQYLPLLPNGVMVQ